MAGGGVLVDHACPECGFDGPHPVLGTDGMQVLVECGSCVSEFSTPIPAASMPPREQDTTNDQDQENA